MTHWATLRLPPQNFLFFSFLFCFEAIFLNFVLFGGVRGWRQGDGEMGGIEMHDVKPTKNKKFKKLVYCQEIRR